VPRGENVYQSIESMNEKAPEEAERGSTRRMSTPGKKVARRPVLAKQSEGHPE
jgi:hypothetical protein